MLHSVEEVKGDAFTLGISLTVKPIGMHGIGRSCHVRYNQVGSHRWGVNEMTGLSKRQLEVDTQLVQLGYSPTVPARLPIYPAPDSNLSFVPENITRSVLHTLVAVSIADFELFLVHWMA